MRCIITQLKQRLMSYLKSELVQCHAIRNNRPHKIPCKSNVNIESVTGGALHWHRNNVVAESYSDGSAPRRLRHGKVALEIGEMVSYAPPLDLDWMRHRSQLPSHRFHLLVGSPIGTCRLTDVLCRPHLQGAAPKRTCWERNPGSRHRRLVSQPAQCCSSRHWGGDRGQDRLVRSMTLCYLAGVCDSGKPQSSCR